MIEADRSGLHAAALGAADYLVKPVDRAKLIETLTNICGVSSGKALLVDDDEVVRRSVRQALEPIGWHVTRLLADFVAKVFLHSRSKFLLAVHATFV